MPQQMSVPALGIAPVADEKVHADPTDSLGRSALMTQLTKPADEMLQVNVAGQYRSISVTFLNYQRIMETIALMLGFFRALVDQTSYYILLYDPLIESDLIVRKRCDTRHPTRYLFAFIDFHILYYQFRGLRV